MLRNFLNGVTKILSHSSDRKPTKALGCRRMIPEVQVRHPSCRGSILTCFSISQSVPLQNWTWLKLQTSQVDRARLITNASFGLLPLGAVAMQLRPSGCVNSCSAVLGPRADCAVDGPEIVIGGYIPERNITDHNTTNFLTDTSAS